MAECNSIGRPKCSIWNYFTYDDKEGTSICIVKDKEERLCKKTFKGKFTTNLKAHLRLEHADKFKEFQTEEKHKKENSSRRKVRAKRSSNESSGQKTLTECSHKAIPYDPQSSKQKCLTRKLALFIGTSNVPLNLVENVEFKELLQELDTRYQVPGRNKVGKELDSLYSQLKKKLLESLNSAEKISLCADIWSKKGMTASFLGLTAHYYSRSVKDICNITIAVRRFESPHTAE